MNYLRHLQSSFKEHMDKRLLLFIMIISFIVCLLSNTSSYAQMLSPQQCYQTLTESIRTDLLLITVGYPLIGWAAFVMIMIICIIIGSTTVYLCKKFSGNIISKGIKKTADVAHGVLYPIFKPIGWVGNKLFNNNIFPIILVSIGVILVIILFCMIVIGVYKAYYCIS